MASQKITPQQKTKKEVVNGMGYNAASVAIATAIVVVALVYFPEQSSNQALIIAGLAPIVNGILVILKRRFLDAD